MPEPVTLTPIISPLQARANLTPEQLASFQSLLAGSGILPLPDGKNFSDIVSFMVGVNPSGAAFLQMAMK